MQQSLGAQGEAIAVAHLEANGYTIIERNWRCRRGEIDIVAIKDDVWIFCEVKTRRSHSTQEAFINITEKKRQRMILAAQQYLTDHDLDDAIWRIDAIGVAIARNRKPIIDHVEDVLDW